MDKHTEGPWETEISRNDGYVVSFIDSRTVAKVYGRNANTRNANARLIAAAPELLDALRRLSQCPDVCLDGAEQETCDALEQAQAAISKAEGNVNA